MEKKLVIAIAFVGLGLWIGYDKGVVTATEKLSSSINRDYDSLMKPKPKDYLYLKSTIRLMERQEELSKQDVIFVLNNLVLEIERLEKTKQEKK